MTAVQGQRATSPMRGKLLGALALALVVACEFMLQLDTTIVNVALPSIGLEFGMSPAALTWVTHGFLLAFGGLLLFGGWLGDVLGHRRVFVAGMALFAVASLLGGLAPNGATLIAGRVLQGVGAALAGPAGLALLITSFSGEEERRRAFAVYSTAAGAGLAVGLILGGLLTSALSWRWVMLINVPVGVVAVVATGTVFPRSSRRAGRFDLSGAGTSIAAMTLLVFGFVHASEYGWADPWTILTLTCGGGLLATFVVIEKRISSPMVPLTLFADRIRALAYANLLLLAASLTSAWFFLTLFLQDRLGYGPLATGMAFLPLAVCVFAVSQFVPTLLRRLPATSIAVIGLALVASGMFWLSRLGRESSYWGEVFGPLAMIGVGVGAALVAHNLTVMATVAPEQAGAASAVLQAILTVGGSIGLAVLVAIAGSPQVLPGGAALDFGAAFRTAGTLCAVATVLAFLMRTSRAQDAARSRAS
ncbi:EmrB/QacA subfamily drug resistance transporter [Tamaricihabitans halophyticus]|uniref:EmrB/QacA subfamily drug resistance transporter n=1 Tax=Tamaricihabitans halophyticus TaxID=1262583 RepID=A0A4R2QGZ8_9PSEU|nr:MFS transporter [Tamaricihabitans halophyticus]TCP46285.1 EmrB/QacA subfamily drug resistance transporter [Tamaricihabitans halophyticus]